jgi:catalase
VWPHSDYPLIEVGRMTLNRARSQVNSYAKDGPMRYGPANTARPYAPNSYGGPAADVANFGDPAGWAAAGEMVREAYRLHREDDDWGQPGTMVRQVLDDAARDRLVSNVSGHLLQGVTRPIVDRALQYWRNIDKQLGDRIANNVNGG